MTDAWSLLLLRLAKSHDTDRLPASKAPAETNACRGRSFFMQALREKVLDRSVRETRFFQSRPAFLEAIKTGVFSSHRWTLLFVAVPQKAALLICVCISPPTSSLFPSQASPRFTTSLLLRWLPFHFLLCGCFMWEARTACPCRLPSGAHI